MVISAGNYVRDVLRRVNVDEWMKYMAINTLLDNTETWLANGVGDDYALYRGAIDTRFLALPYDLDSVMGRGVAISRPRWHFPHDRPAGDGSVHENAASCPGLLSLAQGAERHLFTPAQIIRCWISCSARYVPQQNIENMKAFNASQVT